MAMWTMALAEPGCIAIPLRDVGLLGHFVLRDGDAPLLLVEDGGDVPADEERVNGSPNRSKALASLHEKP